MTVKTIYTKSVLSKSNLPVCEYSVNPYVGCTHGCKYCYASFMKRFTGHAEPWGTFLDVKLWPEIKNPQRYAGKELFLGSVTDPYLPQEEQYGRTRALLEQLQGSGAKLSIATKSDLILRDLDLIKTFPDARVSWSVNTLDEVFKHDMDNAVSIARRLAAMEAFYRAGIVPVLVVELCIVILTAGACKLAYQLYQSLPASAVQKKNTTEWAYAKQSYKKDTNRENKQEE